MDYKKFFSDSINSLKKSGEYRIFRNIERIAGSFPNAKFNDLIKKENIVVWCSNDYLGMGQHPFILEAIERSMKDLELDLVVQEISQEQVMLILL